MTDFTPFGRDDPLIVASRYVLILFMSFDRAIAETPPNRADLRLVVLAQWVRAGLALIRGATTSGRGLVGGAVAFWRVMQAVRLALQLARLLAEARGATGARAPAPTSLPDPLIPREDTPASAAALGRALAELAAAISHALGLARRWSARDGGREPSGARGLEKVARRDRSASLKPRGRRRRLHGRRPLRPPGPARPCRRRWRTPGAHECFSPPIAPLAVGRLPLARAR
jgi:hypothetical protein